MKTSRVLITLFFFLLLISACTPSEESILTVGEKSYTHRELEAFENTTCDYTNKEGETTTYNGVSLTELLEDAGILSAGTTLIFTAADSYQADVELSEALDCADCIVAFDNGSLRIVMPEMSSKLQVRDVVEITVK